MRRDKYSEQDLEQIAKVQSKKNARLKKRRARNKKLRESGKKFNAKVVACGAVWDKDFYNKVVV